MDIDPQAVIDALSRQIGALQTENTVLKMALQQVQAETEALYASAGAAEALEADKKKK
jgi:phage host-nuclease inhibitor protein Gam